MVNPEALNGGDHSLLICGNDSAAKAKVTEILKSFGWSDVVDVGDISAARGLEMYLGLWTRDVARIDRLPRTFFARLPIN